MAADSTTIAIQPLDHAPVKRSTAQGRSALQQREGGSSARLQRRRAAGRWAAQARRGCIGVQHDRHCAPPRAVTRTLARAKLPPSLKVTQRAGAGTHLSAWWPPRAITASCSWGGGLACSSRWELNAGRGFSRGAEASDGWSAMWNGDRRAQLPAGRMWGRRPRCSMFAACSGRQQRHLAVSSCCSSYRSEARFRQNLLYQFYQHADPSHTSVFKPSGHLAAALAVYSKRAPRGGADAGPLWQPGRLEHSQQGSAAASAADAPGASRGSEKAAGGAVESGRGAGSTDEVLKSGRGAGVRSSLQKRLLALNSNQRDVVAGFASPGMYL